jgi:hypothetical protein
MKKRQAMMKLSLFALIISVCNAQKCYWQNGTETPSNAQQTPCPNIAKGANGSCCPTQTDGSQAWCLTNNLCLSDFKLWRGACTDQSWNDPACANVCSGGKPASILVRAVILEKKKLFEKIMFLK